MSNESTLGGRMTTSREAGTERKFVGAVLPWLIAGGALLLYLATLNHWVALNSYQQSPISYNSLDQVAKLSGWSVQPELFGPVYWLITLPFKWLSPRQIPLALNLLSALCAALTLALLARSVSLLPHDRTEEQRIREKSQGARLTIGAAWVPPVFAAAICGLQLTFWENATVGSAEMLNLLLFAYVIRCLLEFRFSQREGWLFKAAFVCGMAITGNWAMAAFLPLFVAAVIWMRGAAFFDVKFLSRASLLLAAGLLFYLVLPIAAAPEVGFWQGLKHNLATQKGLLLSGPFNKQLMFGPERPLWVMGLFSLLPLLVIGFKWPAYFGDPSKLGVGLATFIFHLFHAALLLLVVWVVLEPAVSPRNYLPAVPMLTVYYLGALSAGYFIGYFLLVFGAKPLGRPRPIVPLMRPINLTVSFLAWALVLIVPALLVFRNLPAIRLTNSSALKDFAGLIAQELPDQAVLLGDEPRRLQVVRAFKALQDKHRNYVFAETKQLGFPDYHRFLHRQFPVWPSTTNDFGFSPMRQMFLLHGLAQSNQLYYLHPSFGYFFEVFRALPAGLATKLELHPTNTVVSPPLPDKLVADNERFWTNQAAPALDFVVAGLNPLPRYQSSVVGRLLMALRSTPETNRELAMLAAWYSRSINSWGVEMQRLGKLPQAEAHLKRAIEVNPDNLVAQINLQCNANLQAGRKAAVQVPPAIEDAFGRYRNWDGVMEQYGPFDEPNFCYKQALELAKNGLLRQPADLLARTAQLDPENQSARLSLARLLIAGNRPDDALPLVQKLRVENLNETNHLDVLGTEASAHLAKGDGEQADQVVNGILNRFPKDENLLATAAQVYMNYGYFSNALLVIERHLQLAPNNASVLVNKGLAALQNKQYYQAIPPLTRAMELDTNKTDVYYSALFNRAIAYLKTEQFEDSQRDYEALQKKFPTSYKLYYGLQEIAFRKEDTNSAIRNCELYLNYAPSNTVESSNVLGRLNELKRGSR